MNLPIGYPTLIPISITITDKAKVIIIRVSIGLLLMNDDNVGVDINSSIKIILSKRA